MSLLKKDQSAQPVEESRPEVDILRAHVARELKVCSAVRERFCDIGFLDVDFEDEASGVAVTTENVDEIEAHLRDHYSDRYPDLIA